MDRIVEALEGIDRGLSQGCSPSLTIHFPMWFLILLSVLLFANLVFLAVKVYLNFRVIQMAGRIRN